MKWSSLEIENGIEPMLTLMFIGISFRIPNPYVTTHCDVEAIQAPVVRVYHGVEGFRLKVLG